MVLHAAVSLASLAVFVPTPPAQYRRENVSAVVGLPMCVAAASAAVHAWTDLGKPDGPIKDDAVQVTVTSGRAYR
ncbi:hypothetical protein [Streptomyces sp. H27-S2]|uniref:hypothetical protein n=1 Tax=Streptomyces antarcticus TaxID=2996458 RepID=UPI00226E2792|nr:hypothetical protein [Streptomyces sp. H27-S2]MCY0953650.1 hypothetical protein [Streptomyces sp. H27-S2]